MKPPEATKICVIGLGYIGLPTAALLANRGYQVLGVDIVQDVVDTINSGNVHIVEPGLKAFVKSAVNSGNLKAYTEPAESDIFMIGVPTPLSGDNNPDIGFVEAATISIAPYVKPGNMIILESTSPVGTTERMCELLKQRGVNTDEVFIAYCPERVLPGRTMIELVENDRIVGGYTAEAGEKVKAFYNTFVEGEVLVTNARTAEMSKLTENAYRDVNIAFANELSMVCKNLDIDVWELISLANHHPRVNILNPGSGVGGHCIAVDPWFIISRVNGEARLMETARKQNLYKTKWVVEQVDDALKSLGGKGTIACMGLAFKPNIDDLRESPSLEIAENLIHDGKDVILVEPNIDSLSQGKLHSPKEAIQQADIILYLVAHKEFENLVIPEGKLVIDICGVTKK